MTTPTESSVIDRYQLTANKLIAVTLSYTVTRPSSASSRQKEYLSIRTYGGPIDHGERIQWFVEKRKGAVFRIPSDVGMQTEGFQSEIESRIAKGFEIFQSVLSKFEGYEMIHLSQVEFDGFVEETAFVDPSIHRGFDPEMMEWRENVVDGVLERLTYCRKENQGSLVVVDTAWDSVSDSDSDSDSGPLPGSEVTGGKGNGEEDCPGERDVQRGSNDPSQPGEAASWRNDFLASIASYFRLQGGDRESVDI